MTEQMIGQSKTIITWEQITDAVKKLSEMIPENSLITGIPRNGTIIACFLSHQRPDLNIVYDLFLLFNGDKNILNEVIMIDDIHDTGKTVKNYIPCRPIRSATLFWREKEEDNRPTWFVETIKGEDWLVFPWEKE